MSAPGCPKCGARMVRGFVPDVTYGGMSVDKWVAGEPRRSFWTGLKLKGQESHDIVTWRCPRDGFLEQYAPG